MPRPANPHDQFFKEVFSRAEVAADFLAHHLPAEIAALLQPGSLEIQKDSFVDPELAEHHTDLLYAVRWADDQPGYVYLLFEHKSYPEPRIALDLLRYLVRIWEQTLKSGHQGPLPVVLPLVIYHGRRPWRIASDFGSLFDLPPELTPYLPEFRYLLTDLTGQSDAELRGDVLLQVALLLLKYIFRPELRERLPGILMLLKDLGEQRRGLDYLHAVLRYLSTGTTRLGRTDLAQAVQQIFVRGDHIMSTIAEEWVREGEKKGVQQGIPQGEALLLRRQLTRRFGALPDWAEARLNGAGQTQLETWALRVLDAPNLEAVFYDG